MSELAKAGGAATDSLSSAVRRLPAPERKLLGRSVVGAVSWNMNDTCNYRCSYCTQRLLPDRGGHLADDAAIERPLKALGALPGTWEIKLSGGEPFRQPGLDGIARGLVAAGHLVSIQTNFSSSQAKITSFLEATRGALHVFAASLHLEYATVDDFIRQYAWVEPYVRDHGVSFCVTSVATPERLRYLHDEAAPRFAAAGLRFKVQPEKVKGYVRPYDADERRMLDALGGHNGLGQVAADFQGRLCWAGARYFVLKSSGQAYRCYAASRVGGRHARLGSLDEAITLADGPRACPYTYCNCTVPIERGMIEGVAARDESDSAPGALFEGDV